MPPYTLGVLVACPGALSCTKEEGSLKGHGPQPPKARVGTQMSPPLFLA